MSSITLIIIFFIFGLVSIALTKSFRRSHRFGENDSRKFFHVLIFTAAGFVLLLWGIVPLFSFGIVISGFVLASVLRSKRSHLFQALSRNSDQPNNALFILIPLTSTAVGGAVSVLLFGKFAIIGFFIAGWGDGAAEFFGSRWGNHKFRIPLSGKKNQFKSLEGSFALFIIGSLAAFLAFLILKIPVNAAIYLSIVCAFISTLIEAISLRGTDNFTIQVFASGAAYILYLRYTSNFL